MGGRVSSIAIRQSAKFPGSGAMDCRLETVHGFEERKPRSRQSGHRPVQVVAGLRARKRAEVACTPTTESGFGTSPTPPASPSTLCGRTGGQGWCGSEIRPVAFQWQPYLAGNNRPLPTWRGGRHVFSKPLFSRGLISGKPRQPMTGVGTSGAQGLTGVTTNHPLCNLSDIIGLQGQEQNDN